MDAPKHNLNVTPLKHDEIDLAVALWELVNLTRPWNDPYADAVRAMQSPSSTILAAWQDAKLVGTVMTGHDGHRGWVYYLAISPDSQRSGIGGQLMAAAEAWLAPHVPKLNLMVREENAAAKGFYEKLGYEQSTVAVFQRSLKDV